jgi:hypothetical protein
LSSSTDSTATSGLSPTASRSAEASAATPEGLCAPSKIVSGAVGDDLEAAGDGERGSGAEDGGLVERGRPTAAPAEGLRRPPPGNSPAATFATAKLLR